MQEGISTLTQKGQVTIPQRIRKLLGVKPNDKVAFVVNDGIVQLQRAESIVLRTKGMLRSDVPPADNEREATEQAIADAVVERSARR